MHDLSEKLLQFFLNVARRDNHIMKTLHQSGFKIDSYRWHFLLPELYDYLKKQEKSFLKVSYVEFRKKIFNLPINQEILPYGATIITHKNLNNTDQSHYAMTWKH